MSKTVDKTTSIQQASYFFVPLSLGAEGEDPEQAGAAGPLPAAALRRRLQLPVPGDGPRDAAGEDDGDAGGARHAQPPGRAVRRRGGRQQRAQPEDRPAGGLPRQDPRDRPAEAALAQLVPHAPLHRRADGTADDDVKVSVVST